MPPMKYCIAPVLTALILLAAVDARASVAPRWTDAQLTEFSEVIVTGRVAAINTGWDTTVDTIYTYVTLDVFEVLKGWVPESQIVIKQMGGVVGGTGLHVSGQARFAVGEDVLVFLEVRPRDATLYTSALWQGKWRLEADGTVSRVEPEDAGAAAAERRSLSGLRQTVMDVAGPGALMPSDQFIRVVPAERPIQRAQPFALLGPYRWTETSVSVDYEAGGQPGLAGSGVAEIVASLGRWNAVGAGIQLAPGGARGAKCTKPNENSHRIRVSFMDACQEIDDTGGTLAVGGTWFLPGAGGTVNGVLFARAVDGYVVNNDSATALDLLTNSGCFADIQLHELGHVLGLDHSSTAGAIMEPFINNSCFSGANNLSNDDRAGLLSIYPTGPPPGGTPGTSTNVQVAVNGTASLSVTWTAPPAGAAPTSYRVDFSQTAGGATVASVPAAGTSVAVAIPAGTIGTFFVSVTALNGATPGPPSTPVPFMIGFILPGPCIAAPLPPTGVIASVSGGIVTVVWTASAGATSYVVQAGAASGGIEIFNANVGATTVVRSPVPAGFFAFVQIRAVNACGTSNPSSPISFTADVGSKATAFTGFRPGSR